MPSGYDEMTERAHSDYRGGTAEQRTHRDLLRAAMEAEGFAVYPPEWWHYDYRDWARCPVLDVQLADIRPPHPVQ
jgi:zinc D-Ala-D-Ala dipeptidase